MSKTRKILATLTMVAMTATTGSLTAVSGAQAHQTLAPHAHKMIPLPVGPAAGPVYNGPLFPLLPPPPAPPPPAPPHKHGGLKPGEAAALGVLGGVLIGGVLANANKQPVQPAPMPAAGLPAAHYAYCDAKYKTYVIATNTYTGYDMKPHYCVSPYGY